MPTTKEKSRRVLASAMTPAVPATVQVDLPAIFEKPTQLIEMADDRFTLLVTEFVEQGAPLLVALRRGAGLLAWAARHHYTDGHYGPWLHQFAETLGMNEDTVTRWRDRVVNELGLPVAAVTQHRSRARLEAAAKQIRNDAANAARPPVLELGEVGSPSLQRAVAELALTSAEALAEAATTEQLRRLCALTEEAIAVQRRTSLHARTQAASSRRVRSA